jgi:uncharacterized protein (TIGR00251 family)
MSERDWCAAAAGGARIVVQVTPNARKTEILGVQDGALKIKLQAQPVDGKANDALVRYLAERLDVPRKAVTLTHGAASRQKTLAISGLESEAVKRLLLPPGDA